MNPAVYSYMYCTVYKNSRSLIKSLEKKRLRLTFSTKNEEMKLLFIVFKVYNFISSQYLSLLP